MKKFYFLLLLSTVLFTQQSMAQTCSGEVVQFRETFGTGVGIAPLAAGRTNYHYNGSSSLADGDYALRSNTQGRPEWYNVPDHTGNTDGRMMVTNASYTPGEFYRDTVFGLSSTSTYSVYFYAMNVNTVGTCSPNPILPRLELVVESYNSDGTFTQLSSIVSSDLPQTNPASWVRIAGTYYLPINVTAIRYRIINNATGGCGNDIAIDDITFSQCQPAILPVTGLTLKGKKMPHKVSLDWSVKEDDFASFDIEKNINGGTWSLVKKVNALANAKQYVNDDNELSAGDVQYRIAAVRANGKRSYSNVISIKESTNQTKLAAYPNPFTNEVKLSLNVDRDQANTSVRVFDMKGKLVSSVNWNLRQGDNNLSLANLNVQPGVYFVNVTDRNGAVITQHRLMKQ